MQITIYTTPTCVPCKRVKAFLDKKGLTYVVHDITTGADAQKDMIQKSGQMSVPVTDIDGEILVGFSEKAFNRALR